MKKIVLIWAFSALTLTSTASCSNANTDSENSEPAPTLAETNAGVDAATDADDASALVADKTDDNVVTLKDDNKYRPDMKVNKLTVLDFNATWCGPCKQFAPVFHAVAEKYGKSVDFVSIDTDVNPATAQAFRINAIPTVIFLYPNGKTKTFVGTEDLLPESRFAALVQGEM